MVIFSHIYFPASGEAVVTDFVPSPRQFLASFFFAHRVQQSHRWSIFLLSMVNARSRACHKSICADEKVQFI